MGVKVTTGDNSCRVCLEGELTIYKVAEYRQALLDSCQWDRDIEVDLSEVSELDSAGLQLLAALHRQVLEGGNKLVCIGASEVAVSAFELCRFSDVLSCEREGSRR
jgi:anti-sigma B factor antagonist